MKISYNWLRDYLPLNTDPHELAEILTDIGHEIEDFEEWWPVEGGMKGIVIGKVLESHKHPSADKLTVNLVEAGQGKPLTIVCGAPNVAAGQIVPVALPGSVVSKGKEKIEIKTTTIRGQVSEGMICAEDEIGMGSSHEGIMVLDRPAEPGTPAAGYFGIEKDYVYTVGFTPNRIDSASHFGIARELAAYMSVNRGIELSPVLPGLENFGAGTSEETFEVIIENQESCPRYTGVNIYNVKVAESPLWLQNRLKAIGLGPVNNVVDITNYVQHEIGQPLHAFDADMIKGRKVIIRNLPDKTKFITLDGVERELSGKDLMICNTEEGMCIAGVFGGLKSGVTEKTVNVFLESAYFNPVSIRKTAKRHQLNTDASYRFERGADPEITDWALKRAALLIKEIAGGKIASGIRDIYPRKINRIILPVSCERINRLIGKEIPVEDIRKILTRLGINILSENLPEMQVEIPPRKTDMQNEADVTEEILRIYGYNRIETGTHINSSLTFSVKPDRNRMINVISEMLSSNGFNEIMCNSLVPSAWFDDNPDFDKNTLVRLANPLSSDLNAMRQSLLPGGLSVIARNINHQNYNLKLYEFGNCYFYGNPSAPRPVDRYSEKMSLDLFLTGNRHRQSWNEKSTPGDFFYLKSFIEMIFRRMGLEPETLNLDESGKACFSDSLVYLKNNKVVAEAGRISQAYRLKFDIEQEVYYGHIEWDYLFNLTADHAVSYRELPKFPWVRRDLALLVDREVRFSQIREIALKTNKHIIREVGLFDVYESESLGHNRKSYAVSFILQDQQRTLTEKQIDKIMSDLIKELNTKLGAVLR
ncbi:MAG TPA: phenylalanine--tRNA ligase subunit beta [Bacteroidales bacterium]|nr:phenylalanine--tRNA ligase subunit beta [Bacteroidales bacterium]